MNVSTIFKKALIILTSLTIIFIILLSPNTYSEQELSQFSFNLLKVLGIGMLFSVLIFVLIQELRLMLNEIRSCMTTVLFMLVFVFFVYAFLLMVASG